MRVMGGRLAAAAIAAWTLMAPSVAAAGPSDVCFDAYERAQRLRKEGKLRATQEQLVLCGGSSCPAFVARDCTQWSREVERLQPRVVFGARDDKGGDLTAVQVSVDGVKLAERLDGRAVPVDPGRHVVRFLWGGRSRDVEVVLAEGVLRHVDADFKPPASATPAPAPATADSPPPAERASAPAASWILGGLAVVAGATFAGFALAGKNKEACSGHCSDAEISTLRRDYLIADVSLLVGLVAATGALYFWLSRGDAPATKPGSTGQMRTFAIDLLPTPGGATLGTFVRF